MRAPRSPRPAGPLRPAPGRRDVLIGAGVAGLAAVLSACGGSGDSQKGPAAPKDRSRTDAVVNWANWPQSLDYDSSTKSFPTLDTFQGQASITATYDEVIEDDETYYAQIEPSLRRGQDFGKDLVVLSDFMAARMIRSGYAQRLDGDSLPHATGLVPRLRGVDFDGGRNYSLPWFSGYTGLAYRKGTTAVKKVSDLWKADLAGRVDVLSGMRDTIGLLLLEEGVDIGKPFSAQQFGKALEVLEKQLADGQIRQVRGASYVDDLVSGDCDAAVAWSGDIAQLNRLHGHKWEFVMPEAGAVLWTRDLLIPIGSPHKQNAEILANYYYQPRVAAAVAAKVHYICPVQGAQDAMVQVDPDLADDAMIFPTDADLRRATAFRTLSASEETTFSDEFATVLGA